MKDSGVKKGYKNSLARTTGAGSNTGDLVIYNLLLTICDFSVFSVLQSLNFLFFMRVF